MLVPLPVVSGTPELTVRLTTVANLPIGLAPGLGLNAFFSYSIVGYHGSGTVSYQDALSAVFLEGWIFIILTILGVRQWIARGAA